MATATTRPGPMWATAVIMAAATAAITAASIGRAPSKRLGTTRAAIGGAGGSPVGSAALHARMTKGSTMTSTHVSAGVSRRGVLASAAAFPVLLGLPVSLQAQTDPLPS